MPPSVRIPEQTNRASRIYNHLPETSLEQAFRAESTALTYTEASTLHRFGALATAAVMAVSFSVLVAPAEFQHQISPVPHETV